METEILCADPQIVVCLKPVGIDSEQGMCALLREQLSGDFFCVHRLDKQVGGVMVFARTKQAAAALSALIASGQMKKGYLAVAQGAPDEEKGSMSDLLYHDAARNKSYVVARPRRGVKEARLDYELLETRELQPCAHRAGDRAQPPDPRAVCLARHAARRRRALRQRDPKLPDRALVRKPALSAPAGRPGEKLFRSAARSLSLDGV